MSRPTLDRRQFVLRASSCAVAASFPTLLTAGKTDPDRVVIGTGDYQYEVEHAWPKLPDRYTWQTTHNVAVDRDNNLYVIHEGHLDKPDHPAIFVFDTEGEYVKSFGNQFQGGGHGIEVRSEGSEQFIYVCAYHHRKTIAKLTLAGETVWQRWAPMQSGVYAENEDSDEDARNAWGRDRFLPTNITFLPDGDFFLADGYGSYYIHRYDQDGNWKSCFGGPGDGRGTFDLPHGIWLDERPGRDPRLVIADRAHHTLQTLDLEGNYLDTFTGFGLPANADTWESLMVVPELFARVSLLGPDDRIVARLGDDNERIRANTKFTIRSDESQWEPGKFVHPHDACFDSDGNLYVAEWVATGRITRLKRKG